MGRIKTTQIKRAGKKLMELYGDKFKEDFEQNKKIVTEVATIPSKKLRNVVAGYLTRLVRKHK
ncbi:MAG: 30S ribosomal protein S17e [Nanoarchaeota archaeon]|nr:30S ribosomal protein S17e [Nanoarchaeota archaeon]